MNTFVIPKNLAGKDDLIVIPRKQYELLLRATQNSKKDWINEEPIKSFLKKRISKAEDDFKKGQTLKWKFDK
jgi:hypothetical protein